MTPEPPSFKVTCQTVVDPESAKRFYALYRNAFGELEAAAVARQVLHEHEFLEEMQDPRVFKYVAWDDEDEPVGLSTLTSNLEAIPWISPAYFAHHYPEHAARGAVYYLGFTLVHVHRRRGRVFDAMLGEIVKVLAENKAVCGYDICWVNDTEKRFGRNIERMLQRNADVAVSPIDRQTYYAAEFSGYRVARS